MGYAQAIEANGVSVITYKEFGSYQGTWIAILEDGRYIEGSYGSCSYCDAFQSEFDYPYGLVERQEDGKFYRDNNYWDSEYEITEEEANEINEEFNNRFKAFGERYILSAETKEEIIARYEVKCADEYAWDDDIEILAWLKNQNTPE